MVNAISTPLALNYFFQLIAAASEQQKFAGYLTLTFSMILYILGAGLFFGLFYLNRQLASPKISSADKRSRAFEKRIVKVLIVVLFFINVGFSGIYGIFTVNNQLSTFFFGITLAIRDGGGGTIKYIFG